MTEKRTNIVEPMPLAYEDAAAMFDGIRNELKEIKQLLQQIEQNTQTNGSLIVPKELIALLLTAGAAPKTSIFGGK